ncbi:Uncharacterized protein Fot_34669 [Forsythia ovata]|uniref:Uncharacterized protein n=1 Tax=Forsythia ovata TaxID=205694 RepID=A0ABD1SK17_9LAMI
MKGEKKGFSENGVVERIHKIFSRFTKEMILTAVRVDSVHKERCMLKFVNPFHQNPSDYALSLGPSERGLAAKEHSLKQGEDLLRKSLVPIGRGFGIEKPHPKRERLAVEELSPKWKRLETYPKWERFVAEEPSPKWERLKSRRALSHAGEAYYERAKSQVREAWE